MRSYLPFIILVATPLWACGKAETSPSPPLQSSQFSADSGPPPTGGTFVASDGTRYLTDGIQIGLLPSQDGVVKVGLAFRGQRADGATLIVSGQLPLISLEPGTASLTFEPLTSVLVDGFVQGWLSDKMGTVLATAASGTLSIQFGSNPGHGTASGNDARFSGVLDGHLVVTCSYLSTGSTTTYDSGLVVTKGGTLLDDPTFDSAFCSPFRYLLHR